MRKQTIVEVLLVLLGVCLCALVFCACTTTPPSGSTQGGTTQAPGPGIGNEDVTPESFFEFTLLEDGTYEIAAKGA